MTEQQRAPLGEEPLFWSTMQYRCDAGEFETARYLEVGCEGPGDEARLEDPPSNDLGVVGADFAFDVVKITVKYTASGRRVVPVPFVAGHCPNGHTMRHIDWHRDATLLARIPATQLPATQNLDSIAPSVFIFRYPDDAIDPMACGIPSEWFPGHGMARTDTVLHHQVDPATGLWAETILA